MIMYYQCVDKYMYDHIIIYNAMMGQKQEDSYAKGYYDHETSSMHHRRPPPRPPPSPSRSSYHLLNLAQVHSPPLSAGQSY